MFISYYVLNLLQNHEGRNDTFVTSLVIGNMLFTKAGKILIKNLFELKATMLGI